MHCIILLCLLFYVTLCYFLYIRCVMYILMYNYIYISHCAWVSFYVSHDFLVINNLVVGSLSILPHSIFFSLQKKIPSVITRGICPSVRSVVRLSVRSLVEMTLDNGYTISIWPILFKFGLNIGGWVMHVGKERLLGI